MYTMHPKTIHSIFPSINALMYQAGQRNTYTGEVKEQHTLISSYTSRNLRLNGKQDTPYQKGILPGCPTKEKGSGVAIEDLQSTVYLVMVA